MKIAPEGYPFIATAAILWLAALAAGVAWGGWWWLAVVGWTPLAAWVPAFFRDPPRTAPARPGAVVAPADGRVVSVAPVDEPDFLGGPALRVSIFMNVFNVHVNRHPVDGTVEYRDYRPGRFLNATLDKASMHNERMSLGVRNTRGAVLVRQIAGLIARRIVTDHHPGTRVVQGERLGLIRFGSRVDTFLPVDAQPRVAVGDRAVAGQTIIAEWPS